MDYRFLNNYLKTIFKLINLPNLYYNVDHSNVFPVGIRRLKTIQNMKEEEEVILEIKVRIIEFLIIC